MLYRLAGCGVRIDDTVFIERAQETTREITQAIEEGIARGEIDAAAVFDFDYVPIPGTDPVQYETRFCAFADAHIRPILDRTTNADPRHIAGAATDANGSLPPHISETPEERRAGARCVSTGRCRGDPE